VKIDQNRKRTVAASTPSWDFTDVQKLILSPAKSFKFFGTHSIIYLPGVMVADTSPVKFGRNIPASRYDIENTGI
jgi:hypothetical protein